MKAKTPATYIVNELRLIKGQQGPDKIINPTFSNREAGFLFCLTKSFIQGGKYV